MSLLTDNPKVKEAHIKAEERAVALKKREALLEKRRHRSDEVKIETIKTYLALGGNLKLTAGACNIPYVTLKYWKSSNWWNEVITELRKETKIKLSADTQKILDTAMEQLADRVHNGDFFYDQKTGKLKRKALQAKDLHKITVDLIDRKDKLDSQTADQENPQSNDDKLKGLAERFAALAVKAAEKQVNRDTGQVLDIEFKETTNATPEA